MTNYEYILRECKKAHYGKWEDAAIQSCIERMKGLTREELLQLLTSKWLSPKDEVRKAIVSILFQEQLAQREAKIKDATIDGLGAMLIERNGDYVKLAREELKKRYQIVDKNTQMVIIGFFMKASSKQDKKWGEVREKWQKRGFANPPSIFDSWGKSQK